jgi:methionyl-tRNA formyltransferase
VTGPRGDRDGDAGPARAVFIGSGAFALPILEALTTWPEVEIVGVISAPDRPAGRRGGIRAVPIAARARELGLPLLQPDRIRRPEAVAEVEALGPSVGILADYGQIVPADLLAVPSHGILNVHPSLLPRHRGAAPIPATILAGDQETGVTVIRMDAGLDTGPVVAVSRWPLTGRETASELESRAAAEGAALVGRTIGPWLRGEIAATPQGDGATLTRPLRRDDGRLDPALPASLLERQVRAFQPWPGSFVETAAGRLIVWQASLDEATGVPDAPGSIGPGPDLRIATLDGWLVLDEVQPAGGRRMSGADWLLGRPAAAGSTLVGTIEP